MVRYSTEDEFIEPRWPSGYVVRKSWVIRCSAKAEFIEPAWTSTLPSLSAVRQRGPTGWRAAIPERGTAERSDWLESSAGGGASKSLCVCEQLNDAGLFWRQLCVGVVTEWSNGLSFRLLKPVSFLGSLKGLILIELAYIYLLIYKYIYICIYVYLYVHMNTYVCMNKYICIYIFDCSWIKFGTR